MAKHLESKLIELHGAVLLSGEALYTRLGYRSADAFRQAQARNSIPVKVFSIKNRRGKFALVRDVALWLAQQSVNDENANMTD
ncbi:MAG: hypothetical protein GY923_12010 [Aestuariibacter sp.]|nr:hypothetical protein [Aestuariibacter sp.]MCP4527034.1 hypothetical protein [Aestuariibacter sp.]MCP4948213.1 hypothetical protein [Aestuariibacter sp.]